MKELWHSMKRPNLQIMVLEKKKECFSEGRSDIFIKTIEENFSKVEKEIPYIQAKETYQTPNIKTRKEILKDIL